MAPSVDLAEVLLRFGPAYLANHALSPARERIWRAIVACRTPAQGGQVETCPDCGATRYVYPAATVIARAARPAPRRPGSPPDAGRCCRCLTSTWSSPCPTT